MSESRFTAATKLDAKKPPMELLPWEALEGVALVLDFGRVKYSPWNWRKGFEWGRLSGAAVRHIFAWIGGQDKDPESGLSHIDHAICCLMFLSAHIKSQLGKDDRAKTLEDAPVTLPIRTTGWQWHSRNKAGEWRASLKYTGIFSSPDDADAHWPEAIHEDRYELREVAIEILPV